MTISPLSALPRVRMLGRHPQGGGPAPLFYTAAGFVCRFTGSELHLHLNAGFTMYEPWLSVELNGARIARFPVAAGESEICLFRGMTPGMPKTVRVLKDVQAMHGDPAHFVQVTGLSAPDGEFLPLPAPACRLEFIGDSITSGEGALGAQCEEDWVSPFFSAVDHYARMTADALGADWRIVSQSGWGLLSSWDNDPHRRVMDFYDTVCGLAVGAHNEALGAQQPYDFAAWPADAVIINLGTNDEHALDNPPWTDPGTARRHAPDAGRTPAPRRGLPPPGRRRAGGLFAATAGCRARGPGAITANSALADRSAKFPLDSLRRVWYRIGTS